MPTAPPPKRRSPPVGPGAIRTTWRALRQHIADCTDLLDADTEPVLLAWMCLILALALLPFLG